jgi:hypothetical protein
MALFQVCQLTPESGGGGGVAEDAGFIHEEARWLGPGFGGAGRWRGAGGARAGDGGGNGGCGGQAAFQRALLARAAQRPS